MSRSRVKIDVSRQLIDPGRLDDAAAAIDWASLFGNANPVELEIGSGKGLFLQTAATSRPGVSFLGIELARKYALHTAGRLARSEILNAKIWCGDARVIMGRLVPDQSLVGVHVYFPDPWWKTRHKKRRVFSAELVKQVERTLRPGGLLCVASDVLEYFGVMRGLIAASGRFQEQELPAAAAPVHTLDYLTHFERKYRLEGRAIYQARFAIV